MGLGLPNNDDAIDKEVVDNIEEEDMEARESYEWDALWKKYEYINWCVLFLLICHDTHNFFFDDVWHQSPRRYTKFYGELLCTTN